MSPISDVNGDGVPDFLVAAQGNSGSKPFIAYVSGKTGKTLGRVYGNLGEQFISVAAIGDVNGDGLPDIAVGLPYSTGTLTSTGKVNVYTTPKNLNVPGGTDHYYPSGKASVVL